MFGPVVGLLEIAARTFIVYIFIVLGLRVFGKRELGQMTPFDLVLVLTLSNSVQNAMTGPDTTLLGGLVSATTLLTSNWLLARLRDRVPALKKLLDGEPVVLIRDGKMLRENMEKEGIDEDELMTAIRQHEIDDLKEVHEALLEMDGSISIIPKSGEVHHYRRRKHSQRMR